MIDYISLEVIDHFQQLRGDASIPHIPAINRFAVDIGGNTLGLFVEVVVTHNQFLKPDASEP
jgi:hypothetical protein